MLYYLQEERMSAPGDRCVAAGQLSGAACHADCLM